MNFAFIEDLEPEERDEMLTDAQIAYGQLGKLQKLLLPLLPAAEVKKHNAINTKLAQLIEALQEAMVDSEDDDE